MFCVGLGSEYMGICHFQTRSRSWKCVADTKFTASLREGAFTKCRRTSNGLKTTYTHTLRPPPRKNLLGSYGTIAPSTKNTLMPPSRPASAKGEQGSDSVRGRVCICCSVRPLERRRHLANASHEVRQCA